MKIQINRVELIEKLELLAGVVKENKIRPILSQVLLEATESDIRLTGTDLEQTLTLQSEGDIQQTGKVTIEIQQVLPLLKLSDENNINIELKDNMLNVENMTFNIYDVDEYPVISFDDLEYKEVNRKELINAIQTVLFAAGQDPNSIEINCVRLEENFAAATDRYRMTLNNINTGINKGISIPLKSADNILKVLSKFEVEKVGIYNQDNKISIKIDNMLYLTRLIDLPFPDINGIMQSINTDKTAIIDSISLKKILKKVLIVAQNNIEGKNAAIFTFKAGQLEINAKSDKSKIKEKLKIYYNGEEVKTTLNCKYLIDFTNNIKNMLQIKFSDNRNAFVLYEEGKEEYKYLTMPLATRDDD